MQNLVLFTAALTGFAGPALAAPPPAPTEVSAVVVTTPLAGPTLASREAPAPVQTATSADIERSHALDLTAYLNRSLGSVYINDIQNNPLQPDINYRGYTASPLLGTPQGLSVYMDGVRLNQPFGDVVSWDLIPRAAINSITLMPGSNPLFGLNTLGGALSIRTKDGLTAPGGSVQLSYGSNKRRQGEFEVGGGAENGLNWYIAGSTLKDDGWRDASPSDASQLFAKVGWSGAKTKLSLSGAIADTDLAGNGLQEQRFLVRDYASVYTKPDNTRNRSAFVNLAATHEFSDRVSFSGNLYYRHIKTKTLNGDINDDSLGEAIYQPSAAEQTALRAAGYAGFPTAGETAANTPYPSFRCIANILLNSEPNEKCNGALNRTSTVQHDAGASGQLTLSSMIGERRNQLTVGASFVASRTHFIQSSQFGYLTPDRGVATVAGKGAFADGSQNSENAFDARVNLTGRTRTASAYATDTLSLTEALALTLSGRFDHTSIRNSDAITPGGGDGSLDGNHRFNRFNPAMGLTYNPSKAFGAYAGFTQGSRSPSAIELGCADPDNPCRLPNAMAGDPPLKEVVTRTAEAGVRGTTGRINWRAGVFRADNHNDILFVADDTAGFGYFKNFGKTRRQGVELGADGRFGPISVGLNYTFVDATYRTAEVIGGAGNSTNNIGPGFGGTINIKPGNRIPLVPRNIFKANAAWQATDQFSINADMIAIGGSFARGNENNLHQPDGVFYLGPGKTKGYAVINLGADFTPVEGFKVFAQINNLFDRRYYTGAQLGATGFTDAGTFIARPFAAPIVNGERPVRSATFYAPGAPRSFWVGVKYAFK
ncbi:MAG: TonB-dependent receptor [Caulobacteraceae bacterium]